MIKDKYLSLLLALSFLSIFVGGQAFSHDRVVVIPLKSEKQIEPFAPVTIVSEIPDSVYINGLVTITDSVTGLEWQRVDDNTQRSYNDAYAYCIELGNSNYGGHTDWRLPTIWELLSIVDYREAYPAINRDAFPNTNQTEYWSSTTDERSAEHAYAVDFQDGSVFDLTSKTELYLTRCVRSGAHYDTNGPYITSESGTVTDLSTGLVWQRTVENQQRSYSYAQSYCNQLTLAGGGWRLPNVKELASLYDHRLDDPMFDTNVFPGAGSFGTYWTNTSYYISGANSWRISFFTGGVAPVSRTQEHYVRCVR